MLNCKMGWHRMLGLLRFFFLLYSSLTFASPVCPPEQRDALLQFQNSFVLNKTLFDPVEGSSLNKSSLNKEVDCCSWKRVTCNYISGNVTGLDLTYIWFRDALSSNSSLLLPKLQQLNMSSCNLTKFPYFLNSLEGLTHLDLSSNKISGEIPKWFWGISNHALEHLDLSDNLLKGVIHQLHWKSLSYIDLQKNSFQGPLPIPSPSTQYFYANDNNFTGEISSSICQLSSLLKLDLSNNSLLGNIPSCFGNITNLEHLDLSSNKFHGPLVRSLVKCVKLSILVLSHNEFNDIFPHWLETPLLENVFSNTSLEVIDLSNNKFGGPIPLPSHVTMYYSIASNNITGNIPSLICNATKLRMIDLSNNSLTGSLPQCLTNFGTDLSILNLRMNQLEGTIPQSISLKLTTLDLSRNRFEGSLPLSLVKCRFLEFLDLSSNQIDDTFPTWLGKLPELKVLILRSNNFQGILDIPKTDNIFPKLRILDLSNNNFYGPLPTNLLINLKGMTKREDGQDEPKYMTWNSSSSVGVRTRFCTCSRDSVGVYAGDPSTRVSVRASIRVPDQNRASVASIMKPITVSYENTVTVTMKGRETKLVKILTIFTIIDLSHNSFQGDIPRVIGHLDSLIGLNLSHNHLTGSIPLTLGNLTDLGWLDLSWNMLSGVIPKKLGDLASLGCLNLSKNQLTGQIPQDKQLSTFSSDSFSGNPSLCGTPLPKSCLGNAQPPPPSFLRTFDPEVHESWFNHKVIWLGYASGIVIGISITYIAFEMGRPKWLMQVVRMLERRATKWMEKSNRKAIKFHGQRIY